MRREMERMESTSILQIVSGFAPDTDGMGDFSRHLGSTLYAQHSIKSHYLVYRRPAVPSDANLITPNSISYPNQPCPSSLLATVRELKSIHTFDTALLHYGPYAYSPDGAPRPFVEVVEILSKELRVIVYFHELYASGNPWRRAFWTKAEQMRSVGELMKGAVLCITSNSEYMEKLQRQNSNSRPLVKIPVISNIGEPQHLVPLAQRARQVVVFGQRENRERLYRHHARTIVSLCRSLDIQSLVDVGSGDSSQIPTRLDEVEVKRMGRMEDGPLSSLLADSVAGVIGYWPDVWEKSGVIAAYEAHAMIPVLIPLEERRMPAPSFVPYVLPEDLELLSSQRKETKQAKLQSIADAALDYYHAHQSVNHGAKIIASYVEQQHSSRAEGK
jgi:hypothetical protein